jgi:hypothetical protein
MIAFGVIEVLPQGADSSDIHTLMDPATTPFACRASVDRRRRGHRLAVDISRYQPAPPITAALQSPKMRTAAEQGACLDRRWSAIHNVSIEPSQTGPVCRVRAL